MPYKASYSSKSILKAQIETAKRKNNADLVVKNVKFLDVFNATFERGDVAVHNSTIVGIKDTYSGDKEIQGDDLYLVPGFIDTHVHIESSLLSPSRFEECVLPCGTTTAIWDPHEIANVKGVEGIKWAIAEAKKCLLDIFVMIPSCVPATSKALGLESSGASLYAKDLRQFIGDKKVLGLAEMMNFPGLLSCEDDVIDKLWDFRDMTRDGHCPNLSGHELNAYGVAGIHSCHESTTLSEAKEKLLKGIKVLIREGSCAKNASDLLPLINAYTSAVICLCSDDRNPFDILSEGHIDHIIRLALSQGIRAEEIFRVASFSAAQAFRLDDRGAIAPGYLADFVLVKPSSETWQDGFTIERVFKSGLEVKADSFKTRVGQNSAMSTDNINMKPIVSSDFSFIQTSKNKRSHRKVRVIKVIPNQIVTEEISAELTVKNGLVQADLKQDILPIAVVERHRASGCIGLGFTQGFGLRQGAIACSITHDSHNAIGVGADEQALTAAFEELKRINGGIVVWADNQHSEVLPLPIGGLMTEEEPKWVAQRLKVLKGLAKKMGCSLYEPFLQLSFLSLPVIGALRITDQGLIDVNTFSLVDVYLD